MRVFLFLLTLAFLGGGVFFVSKIAKEGKVEFSLELPRQQLPSFDAEPLDFEKFFQELSQKVSAPPPLRGPTQPKETVLRPQEIWEWTNVHRASNGLVDFVLEKRLSQAAVAKVADMFARQYFEHVSPTGEKAGDLARQAGYEFLLIGENLALGNYENEKALVQAWMDSPGHRANILNGNYREIGIAAGRGAFEGKQVWLAVQIFGTPSSLCPKPADASRAQIESFQEELANLQTTLETMRQEIEATEPKRGREYREKAEEYNRVVDQYNSLVDHTKTLIQTYNTQVRVFNECVSSLRG